MYMRHLKLINYFLNERRVIQVILSHLEKQKVSDDLPDEAKYVDKAIARNGSRKT